MYLALINPNTCRLYRYACRFASIIEDTFTLMMLGLVLYFGIVFCLHGFLLFTVSLGKLSVAYFTRASTC